MSEACLRRHFLLWACLIEREGLIPLAQSPGGNRGQYVQKTQTHHVSIGSDHVLSTSFSYYHSMTIIPISTSETLYMVDELGKSGPGQ